MMNRRLHLLPTTLALLLCGCGSDSGDTTAPLPPALVGTLPTSPNVDSMPLVRGNAEPRGSVQLYSGANCTGPVVGTDVADGTGTFLAAVTEPLIGNADTRFQATATDVAGNISNCSASLLYRSLIPSVSFVTGPSVVAPDGPRSVVIGDLNGDANLDLVVANESSNDVIVLLGDGNGSFASAPGSPFPVGDQPVQIAMGDLNGDGSPDLVTANRVSGNVSVLLGNGDGTFTEPANSSFSPGGQPSDIAIGDLNKDARLDLAVALPLVSRVSVLLGNGMGSFAPAAGSPFSVGPQPLSVDLADLNADASLDIVTANNALDNVSVLLGNGDGTFGTKTDIPVGNGPRSVTTGDLNANGSPDLVTANFVSDNISVLLGNGDGTFGTKTDIPAGDAPSSVAIGDLNRDGRLDLITANGGSNNVSVLLGDRAGRFVATTGSPFPAGNDPASIITGDLDEDGRPDLAIANRLSDTVSILLGEP